MITILTLANRRVERRDKTLEDLVANDFTSPINTIIGMSQLSAVVDGAEVKVLANKAGPIGMMSRFDLDVLINQHIRGNR